MKVKSESEVAQPCPTLSNPVDRSLPVSSVHGIFQARVLEWVAIAFSVLMLNTEIIELLDKTALNTVMFKYTTSKLTFFLILFYFIF